MIREDLFNIQQRLKSNKTMYNEFGKFAYRNLEGILADLKPILKELKCTITFNDEIVNVGASNYIKSVVTLTDSDGESISTSSFAREDEGRSGMSNGQMSGCASSYSRKYAICGLLAINEEKDLDALDNRPKQQEPQPKQNNLEALTTFCSTKKTEEGVNLKELKKYFEFYKNKVNEWKTFNPESQYRKWLEKNKYPIAA